ncbi:MAG TPA: NapC/NirT family cytochrome c [Kofleriaceae bacterium]|jgi:cytochrome c-type protein NapC|nr:NapC/NirT family cytochrome c [Kofleriaceae bacterium]
MFRDPYTVPYTVFALGCAGLAAVLLLWYLIARPRLGRATKIVLLLGIGVLPLGTAANGNVAGFNATKTRTFCSACHVMTPFGDDAASPGSTSLAARHARNEEFGGEACYTCHADYGMFETVVTKMGGMRHVYEYALHFHQLSLDEALPKIHIRRPFRNATCMRCHSTEGPTWRRVGDHRSLLDQVRAGTVSCASNGCHGPAHPFAQVAHIKAEQAEQARAVESGGAK